MGHFKDLLIEAMERDGIYCPSCSEPLVIGERHSCDANPWVSRQQSAYERWLAEQTLERITAVLDVLQEAE